MSNALDPITLTSDATLHDALRAMESGHKEDHPKGFVLVVDRDGRLAGVVSDGDLRRAILAGLDLDLPVARIMTREPVTIQDRDVEAGAFNSFLRRVRESRRMLDPASAKVVVVDPDSRPVDIVPLLDLMILHELDGVYAVVLAGGSGTRLWPLSRAQRPKQFLDLTGEGSMLWVTVQRLQRLLPVSRILVVTNADQRALVERDLTGLPPENVLVEPVKRGTAPSIGLAALHLESIAPDATMLVLPADHLILGVEKYLAALSRACFIAATERVPPLVTIGLRPAFASTAYGYLQLGAPLTAQHFGGAYRVRAFLEKPAADQAATLLEAGGYLWNTGTFAWTVRTFRDTVARCAPDLARGLEAIAHDRSPASAEVRAALYAELPDISIDYALMERAENIVVVEGEFDRIDVGDLRSLARLFPGDDNGNAGNGRLVAHNSARNIVYTPGRLTALLGVQDTIVIVTDDVVLVCAKDHAQEVLKIVHTLREDGVSYV
jgi:mannose-1-phosphate guanylyltransferase